MLFEILKQLESIGRLLSFLSSEEDFKEILEFVIHPISSWITF